MSLLSFPAHSVGLLRVLRYSRTPRLQHALKHQSRIASIRHLQTVQAETSSLPQDIDIINSRRKNTSNDQISLSSSSSPVSIRLSHPQISISLTKTFQALSTKSAELLSENEKSLSLTELAEEVLGGLKAKDLTELSRLLSLYGRDDAQVGLEKIRILLELLANGAQQARDQSIGDRIDERQQYLWLINPPRQPSDEQQKLARDRLTIYTRLRKVQRAKQPEQQLKKQPGKQVERQPEKQSKEHSGLATRQTPITERQKQKGEKLTVRKVPGNSPVPPPFLSTRTHDDSTVSVPDLTNGLQRSVSISETLDPPQRESVQNERPPSYAQVVDTSAIAQRPVHTDENLDVPTLSSDLSRVLFNPGVYQLQDPRSRVYNFDPYLQNITPVNEFNWEALNPYITSSEDQFLRDVAIKHEKRYVGSSSSMSTAMSQFHFLLSAWRPLNFSVLSKQVEGLTSFTQITRAPASIFLRNRNGVYAVDADKEHDAPNILMMHGKSMEKLLTLEKEEFAKLRKSKDGEDAPTISLKPEAYHYSTVENFLLRSQLDAHDPRLPGTGMFDLKTRAVAGVRMYLGNHESGMNYQIKDRFGLWESYEREYYDMIRSAFLKYSLQVRMGRMDGIFVAYHNIARIFGFQYIPISELDHALHGQSDSTIGDREFRMSVKLLNEAFDRATSACPGQSLRFMFETREPPKENENAPIFMRIFAEVVTEDEIDAIQAAGKEKMDDYEDNMARGINPKEEAKAAKPLEAQEKISTKATPSTLDSTLADSGFLDKIFGKSIESALKPGPEPNSKPKSESEPEAQVSESSKPQRRKPESSVLCWKLRIYNELNGNIVDRPENITAEDNWKIHYTFEQETEGVQSLYEALKRRRRTMFTFVDDGEASQNFFLKNIIRMNQSGKIWREEQDKIDAAKGKVVLYSSTPSP